VRWFATLSLLLLTLGCQGCAILEQPETFALCKAADVATTVAAVHTGAGVEANPLMKPFVGGMAKLTIGTVAPLVVVSLVVVWLVKEINNPVVTSIASATTCGVAAHNFLLLR
jgi:uncharacterized protein DUF5658